MSNVITKDTPFWNTDQLSMVEITPDDKAYWYNVGEMYKLEDDDESICDIEITRIYRAATLVNKKFSPMELVKKRLAYSYIFLALYDFMDSRGKQPVGFIATIKDKFAGQLEPVRISPIYVGRDFRGRGIATYMVDYVMHTVVPQYYPKATYISCNILNNNVPSLKVFQKAGFHDRIHIYTKQLK